jgi:hypothetical protein
VLQSCKSRNGGSEVAHAEIEESNRHSREFWKLFAQVSPRGEVFDQDGLSIANAKQPWFFMNVAMLSRPSINQPDLKRRAQEAQEHFRGGEPLGPEGQRRLVWIQFGVDSLAHRSGSQAGFDGDAGGTVEPSNSPSAGCSTPVD